MSVEGMRDNYMVLRVHRHNISCIKRAGARALTGGFTNGAGVIWLDNVQCRGTESRLIDCSHLPLGFHNCVHGEDAGVRCLAGIYSCIVIHSTSIIHLPLNLLLPSVLIRECPYFRGNVRQT